MKQLLNIYKPQGSTPLEAIKLVRKKFPELKNEKIGYAGRLDPLAHGVLLLMIGEEITKQKDKFLNLPKEYEFEVVFGISTDTYDALGILQNKSVIARSESRLNREKTTKQSQLNKRLPRSFSVARNDVEKFISSKLGKQTQIYPPFSSKTVNGKPLFWWAKNNKLAEIKIPEREIEIYDFKLLEIKQISAIKLKEKIMKQIELVDGDFRQEKIKTKWEEFFTNYCHAELNSASINKKNPKQVLDDAFTTARFSISCSSGTYIRSLTNELGGKLGIGAITLDINRTKVGDNLLQNSLILQK
ncbi:hypothetical protein HY945_05645 [Candidatus Gottesmanbacteria bacterium]|nr:hypothetical protein [Candidatus Gottesmanbacteria bacterium]